MSETKKIEEVMQAVGELREEVKKAAPDTAKIEKIEAALEGFEAKSQEMLAEQKEHDQKTVALEEKALATEEQLKALEAEIARGGTGGNGETDYKELPEYLALKGFVISGDFENREQKALLRTDSDVAGGFLVPSEMDNSITKLITEVSNIRSVARVRTIGAKSLEVPVRATIPAATFEGEAEAGDDSVSTYSSETLTAFRQTFTSPITMDMLMDSAFDMESEIMSDAAEAFAKGEGANFVNGDGHKKPKGFLQDTRVGGLTSSTNGAIDADDYILITGELKTGYDPVYVFNRRTLANLRTQKATDGNFLWQPGLNGVVANTINGFPYLIADDMPDIANGSKSVAFGDFMRGYTIVDRTGLTVVRDEFTSKKQGIIEFTMSRWLTGQVTLPESIKIITTKAP
jgi:HK97 family phage major capsid protein